LGESIILLRNRERELRGFYNVCRHRGARLCRAAAARTSGAAAESPVARQLPGGISGGRITCPYHQWTYDLNGRLIAAPWLMSEPEFDQSLFSLYPVGVECWGGFVFVNLSPGKGGSLGEQLGAMPKRLAHYPLSELRIGHTIRYQVGANWKVLCENYNECYHCGGVHPELCALVPAFRERGGGSLDWLRGIPHRDGAYTFTKSGTSRRRPFPTLRPGADRRLGRLARSPPPAAASSSSPQRIRVRWKIFLFLFGFGFIAYVQQRGITVAGYRMMSDLGLTQMHIGWLETALLIGYTAMQFPGGVIGQRLGARRMFVLIGL